MIPSPRLVVSIGVLSSSLSSIFIRLSTAPPLAIATYRMLFATVMMAALYLWPARPAARGSGVGDQQYEKAQLPVRPSAGWTLRLLLLCLASGFFLALHFATWITSLSYTSIASSTVLVSLQPLFVLAGGALFLGERASRRAIIFIAITIAGCALLSFGDSQVGGHALSGDLLALLGAFFVAGYMLIGRVVRQTLSVRLYTVVVYGTASLVLLAADAILGVPLAPFPLRDWLLFAALALVCTVLGHTLLNWSLKFLDTAYVSTLLLAEPLVASLLAVPLFGEVPEPLAIIGGAVTIVGLGFFVHADRRQAARSVG